MPITTSLFAFLAIELRAAASFNENDLGGDFEDVECRNPDHLTYSRQAVPACFRGAGAEEVRRDALPTSSQTKRQSGDALRTRTYAVMSSLVKVPLTRRQ